MLRQNQPRQPSRKGSNHCFSQVRSWLKAGVVDHGAYVPTMVGRSGAMLVLCLLCTECSHLKNLALRTTLCRRFCEHKDLEIMANAQQEVEKWLATVGLELKKPKTRTHGIKNRL